MGLEQIGDKLDEIRDGADVHDAGGMQSVLLRLLCLLAVVARSSGHGRAGPVDPRILQPPPLWLSQRGERGLFCAPCKAQDSWIVRVKATCRSPLLSAQVLCPRIALGTPSHWWTLCQRNASSAHISGPWALPPPIQ